MTTTATQSFSPNDPTHGGGSQTAAYGGSGNLAVKASGGRLQKVLVTAAGGGTNGITIYDAVNPAGVVGATVIGVIPANAVAGTVYVFQMPAAFGIALVPAGASAPVCTISFS